MTLAALIQKGGLRQLANANPANPANDGRLRQRTLARLATLALANPQSAEAGDIADWYQERAAIIEFEGGLSRDHADRQAWARTRARYGLPASYRLH